MVSVERVSFVPNYPRDGPDFASQCQARHLGPHSSGNEQRPATRNRSFEGSSPTRGRWMFATLAVIVAAFSFLYGAEPE